jgi:hypothetical protein
MIMSEVAAQTVTSEHTNAQVTPWLGILWVVVTTVWYAFPLPLLFLLSFWISLPPDIDGPWVDVMNLVYGILVAGWVPQLGIVQWLILRQIAGVRAWWILATAVGILIFLGMLGSVLGTFWAGNMWFICSDVYEHFYTPIMLRACILPALSAGFLQWVVLHGRIKKAVLWILYSASGMALAFYPTFLLYSCILDSQTTITRVCEVALLCRLIPEWAWSPGLLYGFIYGTVTGAALYWHIKFFGKSSPGSG